jgi:type II secretory pathway pseudopilin PulG
MMREPTTNARFARRRPPSLVATRLRASFTLLELLVSLGIILILAVLTMRLLNATLNSDRLRNGARELQTFLAGARDRAVFSGQPRGVRLIQDPFDHSTARSFVYIGAPATFTDGNTIIIATSAGVSTVTNPPLTWNNLVQRGLLTDGATIVLGGVSYTMARSPSPTIYQPSPAPGTWTLTKAYTGPVGTLISYSLQLSPTVLPGDQPRSLPSNVVIDLDNSILPSTWGSAGSYAGPLDLLFNPNGTVMGTVAAAGRIHFVLSEYVDASVPVWNNGVTGVPLLDATNTWQANTAYTAQTSWVVPNPQNDLVFRCVTGATSGGAQPAGFTTATPGSQVTGDGGVTWECYNPKARIVVSLATQTGRVTTSPVNPLDKYRYAEIGEVTQ